MLQIHHDPLAQHHSPKTHAWFGAEIGIIYVYGFQNASVGQHYGL